MERFLRYYKICVDKLPLVKIRKNKKWNFLISASKYKKYTKFNSTYMFLWMTNAIQLVKISLCITKDVKIQDGRQLWLKKSFSVSSKQQDTQIMKFNSHPYTLSLQYPSYSKSLSFQMSLVVVMHFGAGNALHGIEISMFWFH